MNIREVADVALKAGEILLTSGAEIYRVEDTITRICSSYSAACEVFVLPTGMFISTNGEHGEAISMTKRIKARTVDLHRIELINTFSRSLQQKPVSYEEALAVLKEIESNRWFSYPIRLAAAGAAAFVFTLLFEGGLYDGIAALFISLLIYIFREAVSGAGLFPFFEFFISGMIAGGASLASVFFFPQLNVYRIIIGALMILLPGVAITNGIKDALHGDIVSSLARLGEAVFIAAAIGAGVGIVLSIGLRWV